MAPPVPPSSPHIRPAFHHHHHHHHFILLILLLFSLSSYTRILLSSSYLCLQLQLQRCLDILILGTVGLKSYAHPRCAYLISASSKRLLKYISVVHRSDS
ncbi:hypothetical protein TWF696_009381 [Orbilia brochopaga]|uniref:Uncharacterized protein n=1 Tax=Orbilia brochopaga TaxID=3140254 RepID=A0AAV9UKG7_9PEZI